MRKLPNETRSETLDRVPHRKCILTGESSPAEQLVRLALGPDNQVAPDIREKAPGRGAWIGVDRTALENAHARGQLKAALARAFKDGKLDIPDDLAEQVERGLERATLDRLGLEARGGSLLTGSEKIANAARQGDIVLLLHAADAGQDGSGKLDQAWRVGSDREGDKLRGVILPVDRQGLSVALGRQNVVHIGITDKRAAGRVSHMLNRWRHFIGSGGADDEVPRKVA
ncbi:hypothetical protein SAMN02745824_2073 [Parasphingorhabdus marina DSM 22363]|uniref:YlxR domain-containing protein n=1 Tax=Parasphingorhabdus marina DSM 22363 TaxID=1123272 RepID=A0A1N6ET82_9SPHN|nr:DUF448 domain-containing protein [Parasphingorhabdus marina]SIN86133.1 hypothetical protein SAMN02745824_2073 [Parasphingorhabdus marina DSM 22363]